MVPLLEERSIVHEKLQDQQPVVGSVLEKDQDSQSAHLPHWSLQASRQNLLRSTSLPFLTSYRAEWWRASGALPSSLLPSSLQGSSRNQLKTKSQPKSTTDCSPSFLRTNTGSTQELWVTLTCCLMQSSTKDLLTTLQLTMTIPLLLKKLRTWSWDFRATLHLLMLSTCSETKAMDTTQAKNA